MPEESKTTELTAISKGLEASKVLGSVALVLYVVGFLVVTFHVAQFGFVPVSWLRPQYLLAGIWCLLPTLLLVWIISYGIGQSLTLLGKTPGTQPPPSPADFAISRLPESSSGEATRKNLREFDGDSGQFDRKRDRLHFGQLAEVEIDEMVIRPTAQDF